MAIVLPLLALAGVGILAFAALSEDDESSSALGSKPPQGGVPGVSSDSYAYTDANGVRRIRGEFVGLVLEFLQKQSATPAGPDTIKAGPTPPPTPQASAAMWSVGAHKAGRTVWVPEVISNPQAYFVKATTSPTATPGPGYAILLHGYEAGSNGPLGGPDGMVPPVGMPPVGMPPVGMPPVGGAPPPVGTPPVGSPVLPGPGGIIIPGVPGFDPTMPIPTIPGSGIPGSTLPPTGIPPAVSGQTHTVTAKHMPASVAQYYTGNVGEAKFIPDANPGIAWQWYNKDKQPVPANSSQKYYLKPWDPGMVIMLPAHWPVKPPLV